MERYKNTLSSTINVVQNIPCSGKVCGCEGIYWRGKQTSLTRGCLAQPCVDRVWVCSLSGKVGSSKRAASELWHGFKVPKKKNHDSGSSSFVIF